MVKVKDFYVKSLQDHQDHFFLLVFLASRKKSPWSWFCNSIYNKGYLMSLSVSTGNSSVEKKRAIDEGVQKNRGGPQKIRKLDNETNTRNEMNIENSIEQQSQAVEAIQRKTFAQDEASKSQKQDIKNDSQEVPKTANAPKHPTIELGDTATTCLAIGAVALPIVIGVGMAIMMPPMTPSIVKGDLFCFGNGLKPVFESLFAYHVVTLNK